MFASWKLWLGVMKPSLSVWTEFRWREGGAECFVLSAQVPGKRGRGTRLCSRQSEDEINRLKRLLEESDLTSIAEMKEHVKRTRPVATPLQQDRWEESEVMCANPIGNELIIMG